MQVPEPPKKYFPLTAVCPWDKVVKNAYFIPTIFCVLGLTNIDKNVFGHKQNIWKLIKPQNNIVRGQIATETEGHLEMLEPYDTEKFDKRKH